MDMHTSGWQKTEFAYIFIEADEDTAKAYFRERFKIDPDASACNCCGPDFSIYSGETLEELQYNDRKKFLVIRASEIPPITSTTILTARPCRAVEL
jgi:hypothetical protein